MFKKYKEENSLSFTSPNDVVRGKTGSGEVGESEYETPQALSIVALPASH